MSPEASVSLPAGDLVFSARIFVEGGAAADSVRFELQESSSLDVSIDLDRAADGRVGYRQPRLFRSDTDAATDEMAIHFSSAGEPDTGMSVYIDDIRIEFGDSSG